VEGTHDGSVVKHCTWLGTSAIYGKLRYRMAKMLALFERAGPPLQSLNISGGLPLLIRLTSSCQPVEKQCLFRSSRCANLHLQKNPSIFLWDIWPVTKFIQPYACSIVHSHALAVSAFCAPLRCHPTLSPVSLSTPFTSTALASASITLHSLKGESVSLFHNYYWDRNT
jgi:hypothetical protein